MSHLCRIDSAVIGEDRLALIAGPCMAENRDLVLRTAETLTDICRRLDIPFIFKASFDKANRTSVDSYRGPGMDDGLAWLAEARRTCNVPVLTDIHEPEQADPVAQVVDALQIPAFLCRQTDLLVAAAATGRAINVKKGQFMAPWDMKNVADKLRASGCENVMLTDRGTFFGYNRLVTDLRGIPQMQEYAAVCFDATHSVQEPGGLGGASGGQRQFAPLLARSAVAAGADCLFLETHPDPDHALSDAASQIPLAEIESVLTTCLRVREAIR